MEIEKLTLFRGLTEEEIDRSIICSQAKIEHYNNNKIMKKMAKV